MMDFETYLKRIMEHPVIVQNTRRYTNAITLSGLLLKKPKIYKNDKTGIESCAFLLYQVNNLPNKTEVEIFSCMTYNKDLIAQLKLADKVMFFACLGQLRYSKRIKSAYTQVNDIKTLFELDIELLENENE